MRVGEADAKRGALWKHAELSLLITLGLGQHRCTPAVRGGCQPLLHKSCSFQAVLLARLQPRGHKQRHLINRDSRFFSLNLAIAF